MTKNCNFERFTYYPNSQMMIDNLTGEHYSANSKVCKLCNKLNRKADEMIEDDLLTFTNEDLYYLKFLLGQKLKYGGDTVTEMRKYSELYSKIENLLEKNKVNQ